MTKIEQLINPFDEKIINRFFSFVYVSDNITEDYDQCWKWTGPKTGSNRACFIIGRTVVLAYRYIYALVKNNKIIPIQSKKVCHKCDNEYCVNPSHLFLGTDSDNVNDKVNKNRQSKGTATGMAKLTDSKVREIRQYLANKRLNLTQREIAAVFDVHQTIISDINLGNTWKHVI